MPSLTVFAINNGFLRSHLAARLSWLAEAGWRIVVVCDFIEPSDRDEVYPFEVACAPWSRSSSFLVDTVRILASPSIRKLVSDSNLVLVFGAKLIVSSGPLSLISKATHVAGPTGLGSPFLSGGLRSSIYLALYRLSLTIFYRGFLFENSDDPDVLDLKKLGRPLAVTPGAGVCEYRRAFRSRYRSNTDQVFRVIYVGRIIVHKGVLDFLAVARKLLRDPRFEFFLIGDLDPMNESTIRPDLMKELPENVSWIGYQKDVDSWLDRADCVLFLSHREGLPLALAEAATFGCPIIARNAVGSRDCVVNDVTGYLVDPGPDMITEVERLLLRLADSHDLAQRLSSAGRVMAQKFRVESVAEGLHELLLQVMRAERHGAGD